MQLWKKEEKEIQRVTIIYPDGNEIKYYRGHDHHSI